MRYRKPEVELSWFAVCVWCV